MKSIAIVFAVMLVAAPVAGQDMDQFSIFFDQAGTQTSLGTAPGPVTAYLVLLDPSVNAMEITGWEAGCWTFQEMGVDRFPVGPLLQIIFTPAGGGLIIPGDCGAGTWAGGGPWTLPAGQAVVLGMLDVFVSNAQPHGFYDDHGWGALMRDGEPDILLTPATEALSTMPPPLWLPATINSDHVPVADEVVEWGTVKAQYR